MGQIYSGIYARFPIYAAFSAHAHAQKTSAIGDFKKMFVREAYKPSSVIGGHLSRPAVTNRFKRNPESSTGRLKRSFVSCCERGLHRGQVAMPRVSSYLTFPPLHTPRRMRYLSVALSLGSPPPGVTRHSALCSSDFPHTFRRAAALQPHKRRNYSTLKDFCQRQQIHQINLSICFFEKSILLATFFFALLFSFFSFEASSGTSKGKNSVFAIIRVSFIFITYL